LTLTQRQPCTLDHALQDGTGDAMINTSSTPNWTGMVPVDDTALAVTDSGGSGTSVIYLNGQFATQGYWRRVITELGPDWRHITYDERARGRRSGRSADYSFEAAVRDVDGVLDARGVDRALVVGWSYGAFVAAHWVSRNPDRTIGAVLVDGAQPHDWLTDEMEQGIRKIFRRGVAAACRAVGKDLRMGARSLAEPWTSMASAFSSRRLVLRVETRTVRVREDRPQVCDDLRARECWLPGCPGLHRPGRRAYRRSTGLGVGLGVTDLFQAVADLRRCAALCRRRLSGAGDAFPQVEGLLVVGGGVEWRAADALRGGGSIPATSRTSTRRSARSAPEPAALERVTTRHLPPITAGWGDQDGQEVAGTVCRRFSSRARGGQPVRPARTTA
jgi:pimeloyl-ACP methyl ester carboxylesterase